MNWVVAVFNLTLIAELLFTCFCVWIQWKCIKNDCDKNLNVLTLLNFCLSVIHCVFMLTVVGISLVFSNKIILSLTACILVLETSNFFLQLLFANSSAMAVIKLKLTFDFDSTHVKNPKELALRTAAIATGTVLVPSTVITGYHLYNHQEAHPSTAVLMGLEDQKLSGYNFSVVTICLHIVAALFLVTLAKLMAKWRAKKKMSQAVRVAEFGNKVARLPGSDTCLYFEAFSIKNVLYGLGFCTLVVAFAVARNYNAGTSSGDKFNLHLLEAFAVNTFLTLSGIHFNLSKRVRHYVKLRCKQCRAGSFTTNKPPGPFRSRGVGPKPANKEITPVV